MVDDVSHVGEIVFGGRLASLRRGDWPTPVGDGLRRDFPNRIRGKAFVGVPNVVLCICGD